MDSYAPVLGESLVDNRNGSSGRSQIDSVDCDGAWQQSGCST
jgi:hypothetical protein